MEGKPEQEMNDSPEEGERLKINTVIIPADSDLAMRQSEMAASHLPAYEAITDGIVEQVGLDNPPSGIWAETGV